jgi:hypothetical protein
LLALTEDGVISFEVGCASRSFNGPSDKTALSAPFEPKRLIGAVRMTDAPQAISIVVQKMEN